MSSAKAEPPYDRGPRLRREDILQQMERILASSEFHSPHRGRKFFQFVVTETLDGRSHFLKAFTIANEIFGRQSSFDAQNDPVVRVEAGRIRRALERYYLVAGKSDAIVITIPKGGYVPCFESTWEPSLQEQGQYNVGSAPPPGEGRFLDRRWVAGLAIGILVAAFAACIYGALTPGAFKPHQSATDLQVASAPEPIVIVGAFQSDDPDGRSSRIAQALRDEVIGQLATFKDIMVVADPSQADYTNGVSYSLQGNVQRDGDKLRSILRLVRRSDAAVVWANNYDADLRVRSILQIQADIGEEIAGAIAQPYGAVFSSADVDPSRSVKTRISQCTSEYYGYRRAMDLQSYTAARECLEHATLISPQSATPWALLSLVYLDSMRFRYKLGTTADAGMIKFAADAAQRATSIAPDDPQSLEASMLVSFFNNDVESALKAGAAAYALNSNDAEVAGEYGLRLAMSGKWQSGCELISRALNKGAGPKGYYEVGMAMCAFMRDDLPAAELWSRMSDLQYNPMHRLVLLSILGAEGKTLEAKQERDWLNINAPEMMKNIRHEVSVRLHRAEDQERFLNGLRGVGIAVESVSAATPG